MDINTLVRWSFVLNIVLIFFLILICALYFREKRKLKISEIKSLELLNKQRLKSTRKYLIALLDLFYASRIHLSSLIKSLLKMRNVEAQLWGNKLSKDIVSKDFDLLCGQLFTELFPGLLIRLRGKYPTLIVSELRIILLLLLDYDSSKIAIIVNITEASVQVSISKIKNKIGLKIGDSLNEFLLKF